jgi:hypothetical protein
VGSGGEGLSDGSCFDSLLCFFQDPWTQHSAGNPGVAIGFTVAAGVKQYPLLPAVSALPIPHVMRYGVFVRSCVSGVLPPHVTCVRDVVVVVVVEGYLSHMHE